MSEKFAFRMVYPDGNALEIFADGRAEMVGKNMGRRSSVPCMIVNRIPLLIEEAEVRGKLGTKSE